MVLATLQRPRHSTTTTAQAMTTPAIAFVEDKSDDSSPATPTALKETPVQQIIAHDDTFSVPRLAVEWVDVNVAVRVPTTKMSSSSATAVAPTRHILRSVSGEALPGELMVLMGPSGAGKSTLLDCIAGRNPLCTGTILVNGRQWNKAIARRSCYVMQDDLFYANLTVTEHLTFQAQLRMAEGWFTDTARIQRRVEAVINELGLGVCKNTRIGDPITSNKGLSGGQRKRLSLATELLTNPSLLFIDEPTSGLDSFMAEQVVKQMRQLAERGRTIVTTIHQPSSELFQLFDRLYLLVNGRTVYHGRTDASIAYFDSVGHPCPAYMNPTDHFMKVLATTDASSASVIDTLVKKWDAIAHADHSETKIRRASIATVVVPQAASFDASGLQSHNSLGRWLRQLLILCRRHWLRLLRDDVLFKARVGSTIFVTLLAGLVFRDLQRDQKGIQDFTGAIFFISVSQLFMYANPELTTVPLEIPLILREHNGGLFHIWTWFLSKNMMELPLQLILPLLFLAPMYFLMGFDHSVSMFFEFYGHTVLAASAATGLGYLVSCLARRVDIAPILGILFMLPFILFGGMFLNSASTPDYFKWLQALSPVMYTFHCLMRAFWPHVVSIQCLANQFCVAGTGKDVLAIHMITQDDSSQVHAVIYMNGISIGFRLLGAFVLWLRVASRPKRKAGTSSPGKKG